MHLRIDCSQIYLRSLQECGGGGGGGEWYTHYRSHIPFIKNVFIKPAISCSIYANGLKFVAKLKVEPKGSICIHLLPHGPLKSRDQGCPAAFLA